MSGEVAAAAGELVGRVALVTGASRGIGRAIAWALASRGADVLVHVNRSHAAGEQLVAELRASGVRAWCIAADLDAADAGERLWAACDRALGDAGLPAACDLLVNNAGTIERAVIEDVTPEAFDRMLRVNLRSPFFVIQHGLKRLRDGGRIINVSSMSTRVAYPAMAVYTPAKSAINALTLLLAQHLGPRGITVNAVAPGLTVTDMNPVEAASEAGRAAIATIALGRLGAPADIAEVVAFLASDAARWVTGQCIEVSGGQRL